MILPKHTSSIQMWGEQVKLLQGELCQSDCRLVQDLYSAPTDKPLEEQEYAAEKTEVIETERMEAGSRAYVDRPNGTNPPGSESVTRNLDPRKETNLLWLHGTP